MLILGQTNEKIGRQYFVNQGKNPQAYRPDYQQNLPKIRA